MKHITIKVIIDGSLMQMYYTYIYFYDLFNFDKIYLVN